MVTTILEDGGFLDTREGGLVIGPSHDDFGIMMLFHSQKGYHVIGNMEGYEYIINRHSAEKYRQVLPQFCNHEEDEEEHFEPCAIYKGITILDANIPKRTRINAKYLIMDWEGGFDIVNKWSTKKYLKQLDAINKGVY